MDGHWIHSWASVSQPAEPPDEDRADRTLRQTIRASIGGRRLRLRLSNTFGRAGLGIGAISVARPAGGRAGVSGLEPGTVRPVTVAGGPSVWVPAGGRVVTDPVDWAVGPGEVLAVSIHLADGGPNRFATGHPASRTTSYLVPGNQVRAVELASALAVEHWYVLSGLEVWSDPASRAAVLLGDSLTDGRGSTTNGNNRWPDRLLDRLQADPTTAQVALVNQSEGGSRVLRDGNGPAALRRLDEVLTLCGLAWLLVFHGVNDIGTAAGPVAADLIDAYTTIVERGHARGLRVYGATLTPFGGHDGYDDPAGIHEAARQAVNRWIRTGGRFDGVVDFDRAARDPVGPARLGRPSTAATTCTSTRPATRRWPTPFPPACSAQLHRDGRRVPGHGEGGAAIGGGHRVVAEEAPHGDPAVGVGAHLGRVPATTRP